MAKAMQLCWGSERALGRVAYRPLLNPHAAALRVSHACCSSRASVCAAKRGGAVCASSSQTLAAGQAKDHSVEPEQPELEPEEAGPSTAFLELGTDAVLQVGLSDMGITEPSPIQAAAVPSILAGNNVAIQSYTGSGKTLAYLLPMMTLALRRAEALYNQGGGREVSLQALVVCPSQELAMQVVRVAQALLPPEGRCMVQQCIGGANPHNQLEALERNRPIVVVGTPGRLAEFVRTGVLRVHRTPLLVLDECAGVVRRKSEGLTTMHPMPPMRRPMHLMHSQADQLLSPQFGEDLTMLTSQTGKRLGPRPLRAGEEPQVQENFEDSLDGITAPQSRQTVLVSATLSQSVLEKMATWCPSPVYITAGGVAPKLAPQPDKADQPGEGGPAWGWGVRGWEGRDNPLAPQTQGSAGGVEGGQGLVPCMPPHLKHFVMVVDEQHKADSLRRVLHALNLKRALVFMNWQQRLKDVQFKLQARAMQVAVLHGEMPKLARQSVLNNFKRGRLRTLVVSDVVARGLDVPDCDAVLHLELPSSAAHYAHRAGRTGRMGAPGTVITLVSHSEAWIVSKLAKNLGVVIQEAHVSHGEFRMGPAPEGHKAADEEAPVEAGSTGRASSTGRAPGTAASLTVSDSTSSTSTSANGASSGAQMGQEARLGYRESKARRQPAAVQEEQAALRGGSSRPASSTHGSRGGVESSRGDRGPGGRDSASSWQQSQEASPQAARGRDGVPASQQNLEIEAEWVPPVPKGGRLEKDAQGQSVIFDDDDEMGDEEMDEAGLEAEEAQLAAMRVAARGGGRGGRGSGGGRGARSSQSQHPSQRTGPGAGRGAGRGEASRTAKDVGSSTIRDELKRELEELNEERAGQRVLKAASRQQR